ncbi:MAG: glutathione S-transferase family protein [Gammaproteobacteria bacterium]|nr:glutathione S-transferase family protein [Gammaproteobacteria bacterium]
MQLVIGNKNYSSWSMRSWVLLRQAGIEFEEIQLKLSYDVKVIGIERYSAAGKVPVLLVDGRAVWDTLAIAETLAELFPHKRLWSAAPGTRQVARSACAEMHSGFHALRSHLPMNIRAALPGRGMNPEVQRDFDRLVCLWRTCRAINEEPGELLFGHFTIADAFFAPIAARVATYAVALPEDAAQYIAALHKLKAVLDWHDLARLETEFVAGDEPYART